MTTVRPAARDGFVLACLVAYTAVVHLVDTLAAWNVVAGFDWSAARWQTSSGFDVFKFLAWLVVPFLALWGCGRIDGGYFGLRRVRHVDVMLLAALVLAGLLAVLSIRLWPGLEAWYPGVGRQSWPQKMAFLGFNLAWIASWLVGWEFLHRYALLTTFERVWPRYGWLAVPVIETLYHLQKHPLETAGMAAFSLVLTFWARTRRNVLLPFLAHLAIELEVVLFMLVSR